MKDEILLGRRRFVNFCDLMAGKTGNPPVKQALEESIRRAFYAIRAGESEVSGPAGPCYRAFSFSGKPKFHFAGSIQAEADVYMTKSPDNPTGHFVKLTMGVAIDGRSELEDGTVLKKQQPIVLLGRVTQAVGGDPSVYFNDPDKDSYAAGFRHALTVVSDMLGLSIDELLPDNSFRASCLADIGWKANNSGAME